MKQILVLSLCLLSVCLGAPPELYFGHQLGRGERIVGGKDTDITEVPYQVGILRFGKNFCGGSIVGKRHILTAAHCMFRQLPEFLQVRAGSTLKDSGGEVYNVTNIFQHPTYSPFDLDYDVAVMLLDRDIALSERAQIIKISSSEVKAGSRILVSGWGYQYDSHTPSPTLKSVNVTVVTREMCRNVYEPAGFDISENMICALEPEKDACGGDSGGPAAFNNTLVGIVSWGAGCAIPDVPGVYVNVASESVQRFIKEYVPT